MGAGTDWDWGIWEIEGVPNGVEFKSPSVISPVDFQAIASGTTQYTLSGSGEAAAIIYESAMHSLVKGTVLLNVEVGGGPSTWAGNFDMSNPAADILNFDAGGSIQPDGLMTALPGGVTTFSLIVNGSVYNLGGLTSQHVDGRLVGPGNGPTPITGAVGTFHFDQGGAALVDGGYGANLY